MTRKRGPLALWDDESDRAGNGCGCHQLMAALAHGRASEPDVMSQNEPVAGLSSVFIDKGRSVSIHLSDTANRAIIPSERTLEFASDLRTDALVMDRGQIVTDGPPSERKDNDDSVGKHTGVQRYAEAD